MPGQKKLEKSKRGVAEVLDWPQSFDEARNLVKSPRKRKMKITINGCHAG
jgi:hypothetical protein